MEDVWLSTLATHQNHLCKLLKIANSGLTPRRSDFNWSWVEASAFLKTAQMMMSGTARVGNFWSELSPRVRRSWARQRAQEETVCGVQRRSPRTSVQTAHGRELTQKWTRPNVPWRPHSWAWALCQELRRATYTEDHVKTCGFKCQTLWPFPEVAKRKQSHGPWWQQWGRQRTGGGTHRTRGWLDVGHRG